MRRDKAVHRASRTPKEHESPDAPAVTALAGRPAKRARGRVYILTIAGVIAVCAMCLPGVAEAVPITGISGKVTNAETKAGIAGAEVCATPEGGGTRKCAEAEADGEYLIEGLTEGEYQVDFTGEVCNGASCEPLYAGRTETNVKVKTGVTTEHIDAELTELRGAISGKVTSGGSPVSGIEVCVEFFRCEATDSNGEYTVKGIVPGARKVSFGAKFECKIICMRTANYITQWWNNQSSFEAANSVNVEAGKTTTGINAELQAGGQISGKVTTASSSPQPIGNLEVCAVSTATNKEGEREGEEECALTNSGGEYTVHALATHGFEVDFTGVVCVEANSKTKCTHPYVTEFYPGIVSVTAPNTSSGIDASLLEVTTSKPASTTAPALTGATSVGSTLSCSAGGWSNNPASLTYKWLRNGSAIAGQTANTYKVQSSDLGTGIACEVTATNAAGSTGALSNTLQIPKPAPGVAVLVKLKIKGSAVSITLRCTGATACKGALKLLAGHGKHKHMRFTAIAGTVRFSIAVGKTVTVRVHLTGRGRTLLVRAGKKGLGVQVGGSGVQVKNATLK